MLGRISCQAAGCLSVVLGRMCVIVTWKRDSTAVHTHGTFNWELLIELMNIMNATWYLKESSCSAT